MSVTTDLFQVSGVGAEEDDGKVAGGGGGDGRQEDRHRGHGPLEDRFAAP